MATARPRTRTYLDPYADQDPYADTLNVPRDGGEEGPVYDPQPVPFDEGEPDPNAPPAPPPPDVGTFLPTAYDEAKFADASHDSPKYQILRTLSQYDPTGGITDELLAALNALGLGEFSRTGQDKVSIANADPRFEGLTDLDLIQDFSGGNGQWQYGIMGGDDGGAGGPTPLGGSFTQTSIPAPSSSTSSSSTSGASDLSSILATLQGSIDLPGSNVDLDSILEGLLTGDLNQGIIDRRVSSARDTLERQRSAELDTVQGLLADRGLLGDGPEQTAYQDLSERLGGQFGQQVSDIYADEAGRADTRMLAALAAATGLTTEEARQLMEAANIATARDLGFGDLDLRRELGLGQLGLGYGQLDLSRMLGLGDLGLRDSALQQQNSQFWANLEYLREQGVSEDIINLIRTIIEAGIGGLGGAR